MRNIVVIGNGIAGVTAALRIRSRSNDTITMVSDESDYFFSRTALMYVFMGQMKLPHLKPYEDKFWREQDIALVRDYVEYIDTTSTSLQLRSGRALRYDVLIIATGSRSYFPDWPGSNAHGTQGLYSISDLSTMETQTHGIRHAAVVGGGLIGVEAAEMLHSRGIHSTMLVRDPHYWGNVLPPEEASIIERHIRAHGVDLRTSAQPQQFLADSAGRVRAIRTTDGEEIPCEFALIATGVRPNCTVAKMSGIPCNRGVLVDEFFRTTIPHIYAIGDCAEMAIAGGSSRIEPLWYAARAHGETVAETILGIPTRYDPGVFFNSAKFFDIEYQTYGVVRPTAAPGEQSLYREHPDGRRCIRIVFTETGVSGFNLLGVRFRHNVCRCWIEERRSIEYVMAHLNEADFDGEFSGNGGWLQ